MDKQQFGKMLTSLQMMEQYLKRIANEPNQSATTPLSSTSPGRSSKGIFPDSKRIIREQATGSQRSKPATGTGSIGSTSHVVNPAKDTISLAKDASSINVGKLWILSKALNPLSASIKRFVDVVGGVDADKAKNIRDISGIGNMIKGLAEIGNVNISKTKKALNSLSGSVKHFIEEIASVNKKKVDKIKGTSFIGNIMHGISGVLNIKPGQVLLVRALLPTLGTAIKKFANNLADIKSDKAQKGLAILPKMGLGLLAFMGSLALAAVVAGMIVTNPVKLLTLFLVMGASAVAMQLIGKFGKDIGKGALTLGMMGLGLLAFTGLLAISSKMMPSLENMMPLVLTIAGMAGVFYLAGKGFGTIAMGALAMAGVGLATWLISKPIETIGQILQANPSVIWQLPLLLTGLGAVFALAGAGPVPLFIGAGALALGAAGGALWVLSKGLNNMLSLPTITKEKAKGIELGIRSVVTGFGKSFTDLSLVEALTLPAKIPMVGLMGVSLIGLASGLNAYQTKAGGWTNKDSQTLSMTISGLSNAFATAGSTQGMSKLFGFNVGSNDVERGIDSTMRMGKNLSQLADGVLAWKKMPLTPADVQQVSDNVGRVLNVIPGIFAGIGRADAGSAGNVSFLGLKFENPFGKTDTERGITSTMKMGENLKNLAEGVMAWKDGGKAGFNSAELPSIQKNIELILGTIPGSFASLGSKDRATEGIWPWSDGDITNGVELAEKLGPSLQGIAKLLETVKTGNMEQTTKDISTHIPKLLATYAASLNDFSKNIGGDPDDTIDSLEDFLDLADPMEKMAASITSMTAAMKGQLELGKTTGPQLEVLGKYYDALAHISTADTAILKQNLDAVVKSKFSMSESNAAMVTGTRINVTNTPQEVQVKLPGSGMTKEQETFNTKMLEALNNVAMMLGQLNGNSVKQNGSLNDLIHTIQAGIKTRPSETFGG